MPYIYHIATKEDWESAKAAGSYEVPSLKEEGFIHCSMEEQVPRVLSRFYAGGKDLLVLRIDSRKLSSQLVYEWSPSMEATFPHVYGPINVDAVTEVQPADMMASGDAVV